MLRVSCIFVADGAEIGQKAEDLLEVEPLACRVRDMWCKVVFCAFLQFSQNLVELAHGVSPGHADILILEHEEIAVPRPGLFLLCSAQVQLGQCLLIGPIIVLGLDDGDFLPTFMAFLPTFILKVGRNELK